ncbi:MAG TPA: CsbD family protein [Nevskiaceae bacterium]|nr:CsbD family protein [Nevskiaceae bacterium]
MNSDTLKGRWKELKGNVKQQWSKLTDDDMLAAEGGADKLSGAIQKRYGIARDEADRQIQNFLDSAGDAAERAGKRMRNESRPSA